MSCAERSGALARPRLGEGLSLQSGTKRSPHRGGNASPGRVGHRPRRAGGGVESADEPGGEEAGALTASFHLSSPR